MNKLILFLFIFLGLLAPVFFASAMTGTIDSTNKYAWGENIGWINFGCTNCNIQITDSSITGYAWSKDYGWINLNPTNGGVLNNGLGVLSGYAWGKSIGWINFTGVSINSSGHFTGEAIGGISGRINFDCTETGCPVTTDWRAPVCGDGTCNGSETCSTCPTDCGGCGGTSHNECNAQQCISVNGPGADQCQTSSECSHNECNAQQQCVPVTGPGTSQCTTSSDCPAYNKCAQNAQMQYICESVPGVGTNQCSTSSDCYHNECNAQNQCISVGGPGTPQCQTSTDCTTCRPNGDINKNGNVGDTDFSILLYNWGQYFNWNQVPPMQSPSYPPPYHEPPYTEPPSNECADISHAASGDMLGIVDITDYSIMNWGWTGGEPIIQ